MTDPSAAVDSYLAERFKIGLEQVLVDASVGKMAPGLAGTVEVTCRERGCFHYPDRGRAYHYEGAIIVAGVAYRYRTWIYEEHGGTRYMTDLSEFAPVDWQARLRITHGR